MESGVVIWSYNGVLYITRSYPMDSLMLPGASRSFLSFFSRKGLLIDPAQQAPGMMLGS